MARKKFLRSKWRNYSKLGRRRKKKQKYRRPRGRHSKMREKRKGNPPSVRIGYKKSKKGKETEIKIVMNLKELPDLAKGARVILGKIGKKKKIEIVKKAKEYGINVLNLDLEKFLEKIEKEKRAREKKKEKGKKLRDKEKKEKKTETSGQETKEEKKNKNKREELKEYKEEK